MTAEPDRIARESLQAQAALAPYMLASLVMGVLFLLPVAWRAPQPLGVLGPLLAFAVAFGAFRAAERWLQRRPQAKLAQRQRVHVLTGLVFAASLLPLSAYAAAAGPARELLLLLGVAAAVLIVFFTAPNLPSLLIVGPVAVAAPLWLLALGGGLIGRVALGAVALAFALAMILNRSHRRQFELAAEREALMAQRAAALAEAERLARAKSALISTLSSQVRSGLAGVEQTLSFATAARRGRAAARDPLGAALDGVRELGTIVDTALDSEEAEAGRLTLRPEPFDLLALAQALSEEHRPAASAKGLELDFACEGEVQGLTFADAHRVRQVLAALLANAVRYTVRGRVELRLIRDDRAVRVAVADTGPGLSAEELALAFEPFGRVLRTSAGVAGSGLGLALASRLTALMGAHLQADSAVGVGSRFSFSLPFEPGAPAEAAPVAVDEPLRLLTAGGDALSAALLRSVLEELGHKVVHAAKPERTITLARRAEFDGVVLDAGADTPATLAAIRGEPSLQAAPLLALIDGEAAEGATWLAAGADILVRKPAAAPALAQALAEASRLRSTPALAA